MLVLSKILIEWHIIRKDNYWLCRWVPFEIAKPLLEREPYVVLSDYLVEPQSAMLSKHASSVERFNTDTPSYAPIEDSSDEDDDEVDFQYKDTDMDIRDESSFLADGAPVADGSQNCDVGDIVLDVNGLRVKFKVCSISSELFLNPAIILTC